MFGVLFNYWRISVATPLSQNRCSIQFTNFPSAQTQTDRQTDTGWTRQTTSRVDGTLNAHRYTRCPVVVTEINAT